MKKPRPVRPKLPSQLTVGERAGLYGAIAAALLSAVLTPVATYYWFDPSAKEYEYRGRLIQVDFSFEVLNWIHTATIGPNPTRIGSVIGDVRTNTVLLNAGQRPVKGMEIVVGVPQVRDLPTAAPEVVGRPLEKVSSDSNFAVYSIKGALAPGEYIEIRYQGPNYAQMMIRTEYGDTLPLHRIENPP